MLINIIKKDFFCSSIRSNPDINRYRPDLTFFEGCISPTYEASGHSVRKNFEKRLRAESAGLTLHYPANTNYFLKKAPNGI